MRACICMIDTRPPPSKVMDSQHLERLAMHVRNHILEVQNIELQLRDRAKEHLSDRILRLACVLSCLPSSPPLLFSLSLTHVFFWFSPPTRSDTL